VTRLLPGALGNEASSQNESFSVSIGAGDRNNAERLPQDDRYGAPASSNVAFGASGLLDFPHYTRPAEFRGWSVPEVLIGGNHAEVAKWRRAAALEKTKRMRPELLSDGRDTC
jgi:tRNA (guanine37-N1)-methyltransferase